MSEIKHEGFSTHRLRQNRLEAAYAEAWAEQAPHTLGSLLASSDQQSSDFFNFRGADYSARDAQVAATMIQWLGSPVGSDFVRQVLKKAATHDH